MLRALCGVVADGAHVGAEVAATLATLEPNDPNTAASITRAREVLGTPAPRRPLQLPVVAPGRLPGNEALATATIPREAVITAPSEQAGLGVGWRRLLLGMGLALEYNLKHAIEKSDADARAAARYGWAGGALLMTLGVWLVQERVQPYALHVQNRLLARWLVASNVLLLLLGVASAIVAQFDESSEEPAVERVVAVMLVTLSTMDKAL